MKPTKVAAVVAGSMMALAAAAPAFAAPSVPTSLDGGLDTMTSKPIATEALSSTTDGSVVNTVTDTADNLNESKPNVPLVGGLPIPGK
ncbi:hypothetical protein [Streptomyces purpureus]|uniref:Secreted protein n=1 Tax=Streptomyces purpureus TaxID=1951 RepID=A0A918HEU2_9ACTN|nr:hypothetical protein [Streptomyces purpureus]GGT52830.1 hypothetical protein GCM10014713_53480 [Streptomyces purpureus]